MHSDFGRPFDVELVGIGSLGLSWQEWGAVVSLAKAFGWAAKSGDPTPASESDLPFGKNWDGLPFTGEIQQVTDAAAMALATALRAAITAWETDQALTTPQLRAFAPVPKARDSFVTQVADYASRGAFTIKYRA